MQNKGIRLKKIVNNVISWIKIITDGFYGYNDLSAFGNNLKVLN